MNLREEIEKYVPYNEQEEIDKRIMIKFIDTFDDVLTRNNEIGHFVVSAWIVNKERTKVLMIYHNIYKSWAWIGGHADGEQNLLDVIKREIEEETGIKNAKLLSNGIYGIANLTVDPHIKRGKFVSTHLHLDVEYLFEADENGPLRIKEDENSDVKWIPIEDAVKSSTEEKMKPIYQKLIDKLNEIM